MTLANLDSILYEIGEWVPVITIVFLGLICYFMWKTVG